MSTPRPVLEHECRTFTRYLAGRDPTPYVVAKYCEAHEVSAAFGGDRFDRRLTAAARYHSATTLLADAYARFFAPHGLLRKKLVLLLAILEISPPFFQKLNRLPAGGRVAQTLYVGARLLLFGLALLGGVMAFLPVQLVTPKSKGRVP